ncbi:MAG: tetratricopeptide repeat protein [Planctomycetes bacterium]|nr:tetratricopeptide repeat protein [Planctomycetota bacterium]
MELAPASADAWAQRGVLRAALGRAREALPDLERALALAPDHVEALANRGLARALLGDAARGRADLERALALRPGEAALWVYLALALRDAGAPRAEVIAACDRALALAPERADALGLRGQARLASDPAGAVADLFAALERTPPGPTQEAVRRSLERARALAAGRQ